MKWAVFVGGTGSNLSALLESGLKPDLVVSHRASVQALAIAAAKDVPTRVILQQDYVDRLDYDAALARSLAEFQIEAIAMAGFLRWLTPQFTRRYRGNIVNLHPSLLPAYPGLHAIERAFADGVLWSGVTIHYVDEGHDTGPIIAQVPVPRMVGDTLEDFSERIHIAEHRLYPRVISALDEGRVRLQGDAVVYEKGEAEWMHGH